MAEQLIGFDYINEKYLMSMNVKKARRNIATSLISNSGNIMQKQTTTFMVSYITTYVHSYSGYV